MNNLTILWSIVGIILCAIEFTFPTTFDALMMGIGAFLVALLSLVIPQFIIQALLWLFITTMLIFLSRHFLNAKPKIANRGDDREGETITEIPADGSGRVIYEGVSWRAKCVNKHQAIPPNQKIYIINKEGNTLIVSLSPDHEQE
jgi:membrane protein implicated in regulation of membrane protease activity